MKNYLLKPSKLQFELSSMCNALCLGCVRTDSNTFNNKKFQIPDKQYIKFEVFKKILLAPEFASVDELEFCGTIDDPLMHPELLEFLDFASTVKNYTILIHTNASLRNVAYWKQLAQVLKKHRQHSVRFSVDGLEDTNHLYRQNTTWSKIMKNARAFIQEGGRASWQYLIFPWNEHQLMTAKTLSVDMGFYEFVSRHDRSQVTSWGLESIQNIKLKNKQSNLDYKINVSDINKRLESSLKDNIKCNNQTYKMYFISFDSKLWPCCFLNNGFFQTENGKAEILEQRLFDAYGDESWNDISKHSIGEILNHEFYTSDLLESWDSTIHGLEKGTRIHRCTEVCSVKKLEKLPIGNYKVL